MGEVTEVVHRIGHDPKQVGYVVGGIAVLAVGVPIGLYVGQRILGMALDAWDGFMGSASATGGGTGGLERLAGA